MRTWPEIQKRIDRNAKPTRHWAEEAFDRPTRLQFYEPPQSDTPWIVAWLVVPYIVMTIVWMGYYEVF